MLACFQRLADERIKKAQSEGQFDDLPGAGRPLDMEDDSLVPPDLRMAYKILRNAGFVPPEVSDRKELMTVMDLLESAPDERHRYRQMKKLEVIAARIQAATGRDLRLESREDYYDRLVARVRVRKDTD